MLIEGNKLNTARALRGDQERAELSLPAFCQHDEISARAPIELLHALLGTHAWPAPLPQGHFLAAVAWEREIWQHFSKMASAESFSSP